MTREQAAALLRLIAELAQVIYDAPPVQPEEVASDGSN